MIGKESKDLVFVDYDQRFAEECHDNFLGQQETARFTLWKPTASVEEAKNKLNFWTANLNKNDIFCLIFEKERKRAIGFVCAYEIAPNVYGDVGIAVGVDFVKRGFGAQALSALIETVKKRGAKELHYSHLVGNEASKQLALKFGFAYYKQEKRLRKYDNREFDELFYVLKF